MAVIVAVSGEEVGVLLGDVAVSGEDVGDVAVSDGDDTVLVSDVGEVVSDVGELEGGMIPVRAEERSLAAVDSILPASDVKLGIIPPSLDGAEVMLAEEAVSEVGLEATSEVGLEAVSPDVGVPELLLADEAPELSVMLADESDVALPLDESVAEDDAAESVIEAEEESVADTEEESLGVGGGSTPPGSVELAATIAEVGESSPNTSSTTAPAPSTTGPVTSLRTSVKQTVSI